MILEIRSAPQTLSWRSAAGGADIWIAALLEGAGQAGSQTVRTGDILLGTMSAGGELTLLEPFRLIHIRLSAETLDPRLQRLPRQAHLLARTDGVTFVLGSMLQSVADTVASLDAAERHAVELSVSELLISALSKSESLSNVGTADRRRSTFQRLIQAIESRLHDPELTLTALAEAEGLSIRAIQKLFQEEHLGFGRYLRNRRLERAAHDLANGSSSTGIVADIGFRWGFTDPAHFSRAFREKYGVTPTIFRNEAASAQDDTAVEAATRGRPRMPGRRTDRDRAPPDGVMEAGAPVDPTTASSKAMHHHLPVNARTVHWGYFDRSLAPVLTLRSGDTVTVETLSQHATDDAERMIAGDAGAESVMGWSAERKNVDRRGAGPMDASIYGRGAGEGFGVHICTGPIAVEGAAPGDVLEIEILDIRPRPSKAPGFIGRSFGSNAAVWWGYHYHELLTEPRPREVVTLYELKPDIGDELVAEAVYSFRWTTQRDPYGVSHPTIDYPGVPVDHATIVKSHGVLAGVRIPARLHFGIIALAPAQSGLLDSTPPSAFGGNIDNWRLGPGTRLFLPVSVPGGLLSIGDPHAAQGDGEVSGTAIECSLTGTFRLRLHKRNRAQGMLRDLTYPLIETPGAWVVQGFSHPNYLSELGQSALSDVYKRSSLDSAMRDAFRKARRLLMAGYGFSEDEAISLISAAVDFGVTQVVDGNLGIHAIIPKRIMPAAHDPPSGP